MKVCRQSHDDNSNAPHPQLYILSVGCTVSARQAGQKHYKLPSARGLQIWSDSATTGGIRGPLPKRNPLGQSHLGKPRHVRRRQVRAPEVNICRRLLLDRPVAARLLPKRRENQQLLHAKQSFQSRSTLGPKSSGITTFLHQSEQGGRQPSRSQTVDH